MIIICNKLLENARGAESGARAVERAAHGKRDTRRGGVEGRRTEGWAKAFAIKMCKIHDATVENFMK